MPTLGEGKKKYSRKKEFRTQLGAKTFFKCHRFPKEKYTDAHVSLFESFGWAKLDMT